MKHRALVVFFWIIICLLAVSLLLTIVGSSYNNDAILNAGIIAWLTTTFLFFVWLVIWFWSKAKKYRKRSVSEG